MKKFSYYSGMILGVLFSSILFVYPFLDGYMNHKNNHSVAPDVALLFIFFIWQKVSRIHNFVKEFALQYVYNSFLNDKKEE